MLCKSNEEAASLHRVVILSAPSVLKTSECPVSFFQYQVESRDGISPSRRGQIFAHRTLNKHVPSETVPLPPLHCHLVKSRDSVPPSRRGHISSSRCRTGPVPIETTLNSPKKCLEIKTEVLSLYRVMAVPASLDIKTVRYPVR